MEYKDTIDQIWETKNIKNRARSFNISAEFLQRSCLKIGMKVKKKIKELNMDLSNMNDIITYFYTDSLSDFLNGTEPEWVRGVFNTFSGLKSIKFIRPSVSSESYPINERYSHYGYKLPSNNRYCEAQQNWAEEHILELVNLLILMGFGQVDNPDRDVRRKDFCIKFGIILNNIVMFVGLRCISLNWDSISYKINECFRMPNYIIENCNPKALAKECGRQVMGHSACRKKMDGTEM